MNRYIDALNRIRQNADASWLTPNQKAAYTQLIERWQFLDEINLWGSPGSGKTFIGWVLHKQGYAIYVSDPKRIPSFSVHSAIIVDNCFWSRQTIRKVLQDCRLLRYQKIALITSEPAQDQIACIEVKCSPEDLERAAQNLRSIRLLASAENSHTLWDLVTPIPLR